MQLPQSEEAVVEVVRHQELLLSILVALVVVEQTTLFLRVLLVHLGKEMLVVLFITLNLLRLVVTLVVEAVRVAWVVLAQLHH
jgi:hypothetical protein